MQYEDDLIKIQRDGDSVDLDFRAAPEDGIWIGVWGVDVRLLRVRGEDGDPDTLVVSVWEPGVVSSPVAELSAYFPKGSE